MDFDYVTLSSLNRHAAAGLADVGTPKVKCLEKALRKFSRWIEIDPRVELWKKEDGGSLLEGVDWVVGMALRCVVPSGCSPPGLHNRCHRQHQHQGGPASLLSFT